MLTPHRAWAAFWAIAFLFLAESFSARALPPLRPPNRPRATAAGFLAVERREPSVFISTTADATWLIARFRFVLDRFGIAVGYAKMVQVVNREKLENHKFLQNVKDLQCLTALA